VIVGARQKCDCGLVMIVLRANDVIENNLKITLRSFLQPCVLFEHGIQTEMAGRGLKNLRPAQKKALRPLGHVEAKTHSLRKMRQDGASRLNDGVSTVPRPPWCIIPEGAGQKRQTISSTIDLRR